MITWSVPLGCFPNTCAGRPLACVPLAAQERHSSIYLMGPALQHRARAGVPGARWRATGRRLDMGRACLRFRTVGDLDLPLLHEAVASSSVVDHLALYAAARSR
ncbi:MAG: hypothetical protein JWN08_2103 [Frankiales bacterium]|nr:hypothetical protein [Frankiales bacterium]